MEIAKPRDLETNGRKTECNALELSQVILYIYRINGAKIMTC